MYLHLMYIHVIYKNGFIFIKKSQSYLIEILRSQFFIDDVQSLKL